MVREILTQYNKAYRGLSEEVLDGLGSGVGEALSGASFSANEILLIEYAILKSAAAGMGLKATKRNMSQLEDVILSATWGKGKETVKELINRRVNGIQSIIDSYVQSAGINMEMANATLRQIVSLTVREEMTEEMAKKLTRKLTMYSALACGGADSRIRSCTEGFIIAARVNTKARLLPALNGLVMAVDSVGKKYLEYAVSNALTQRMAYNLERIVRTESQRAWFSGFLAKWQDDPDVFGYRWVLSKRHNIFDQCDVCANADVGYGKGVYPKTRMPRIPLHPNCMCTITPVFKKDVPKNARYDSAGVAKYIRSLTQQEQLALFGERGRGIFRRTGNWEQNLRGWEGYINPNEFSL